MRTTLQLNLPPTLVQSVSPARESAAPAEVPEVSLTRLLAESVEETGCSEKDAALSQGYPPNYWSRIKSGEKAAHLEKLSRLPVRVQQEFVRRYARELKMQVREMDARTVAALELAEAALRYVRESA
jgi:hypothetical protein